jgi:hypothetical protein
LPLSTAIRLPAKWRAAKAVAVGVPSATGSAGR